jgi:hypothetical protein
MTTDKNATAGQQLPITSIAQAIEEADDSETVTRADHNKALNALATRSRKQMDAFREEWNTRLAELAAAKEERETAEKGERDPAIVKLQKQVEAQQKAIEERERMIAEEKSRQQDSFARQSLHEAMTSMGVKPELAPFVISHLYADQKKIKARDGSLFFETGDEIEPEVDFKKGLEKFLKTSAGQHFLAPKSSAPIVGQPAGSIADFLNNRNGRR